MTGTSTNTILWLEPSPSDSTILEQVYHCRCGAVHRGKHAAQDYRHHECFHARLEVIDATVDGDFVVYCKACESAWIAPCVAEGLSVHLTKSAMSRGCQNCRQLVMSELKEKSPDHFLYHCPDCGEHWEFEKE